MSARPDRRLMAMDLPLNLILSVCHGKPPHALPRDARIVNLIYDHERDCLSVVLASKDFEPLPERAVIPRLESE
jgi:hypothetical protein